MTTLAAYAQLAVSETLSYDTDVIVMDSGLEQRIANQRQPLRRWQMDLAVDLEADRRALRKALFLDPVSAWQLPIRTDDVIALTDITGVSVTIDSTYVDWLEIGQAVYVDGISGGYLTSIDGWLGSGSSTAVTFADSPPAGDFSAGQTRIAPVYSVLLADAEALQRSGVTSDPDAPDVGAGRWRVMATMANGLETIGTGATVTSFDSLPVLDRRPIVEGDGDSGIEEQFRASLRRYDYGGAVTQMWSWPHTNIIRGHRWMIGDRAELQWWRLFIDTAKGMQGAFLCPTWQPDLDLHAVPVSGAMSIQVEQNPGFAAWFATAPHKWLMLWEGDEDAPTFEFVKATVVSTAGGHDTITVSAALSGDAPTTFAISMVELARFGEDDFVFDWVSSDAFLSAHVMVVQR